MSIISIKNDGNKFNFSNSISTQEIVCNSIEPSNLVIPSNQPSNEVVGSSYFDTDRNEFLIYDGSDWISTPGPTGPQGERGYNGSDESSGSNGSDGKPGPTGIEQFTFNKISNFGGNTLDGYYQFNLPKNVKSIAMDATGQYQYACCQGTADVQYKDFIYKSSDYGRWWSDYGNYESWTCIAVSTDGKYITGATSSNKVGAYNDNGGILQPVGVSFNSIAMSSSGQYQSATVYNGKIWTSSDYGYTWIQKTSSSTELYNEISMSGIGDVQIVVSGNRNGPGKVYMSTNFGNTWSLISGTGKPINDSPGFCSVKISTNGKYATILATMGNIYSSSDFCNTWSVVGSNGNAAKISMSSNGQYQAYVNYDAQNLFYSTDYGVSFTRLLDYTIPNPLNGVYSIKLSNTGEYIMISNTTTTIYNYKNQMISYTPFFDVPTNNIYIYNGTSWTTK